MAGEREREEGSAGRRQGKSPLTVVLAADAGYAMQVATSVRSLVEHNRRAWPVDVHVFWEGPDAARRRIERSLPAGAATFRWIPADLDRFRSFALPPGLTAMAFARILIPDVFSEATDRVLYLDADTLVLDELDLLWRTELGEAVVGAVVDAPLHSVGGRPPGPWADAARCDDPVVRGTLDYCTGVWDRVPPVADYFNSGVLLIDLPRWRREAISERAIAWLGENPTTPFCDQDALNVACDGKWMRLDRRWNDQDHLLVPVDARAEDERPGIVHFITTNKPWSPRSHHRRSAALWDDYRRRTAFARSPIDRLAEGAIASWWSTRRSVGRWLRGRKHPHLQDGPPPASEESPSYTELQQ